LTFRMKNNDDTAGTFLFYTGGVENDFYPLGSVTLVLKYLLDRTSDSPTFPLFDLTVFTNDTASSTTYARSLMTEEAGRLMDDWIDTGKMSWPLQTTIFTGTTSVPGQP